MVPTSIAPGLLKNLRKWGPVMIPDMTLHRSDSLSLLLGMRIYALNLPLIIAKLHIVLSITL